MVGKTDSSDQNWFHMLECAVADVDGIAKAVMFIEIAVDELGNEDLACLMQVLRLHAEGVAQRGTAAIEAAMNAGAWRPRAGDGAASAG